MIARSQNLNAQYTAFVVFFDIDGQMEVWPHQNMDTAKQVAKTRQENLESFGADDAGSYRAMAKLPRRTIYKLHPVA